MLTAMECTPETPCRRGRGGMAAFWADATPTKSESRRHRLVGAESSGSTEGGSIFSKVFEQSGVALVDEASEQAVQKKLRTQPADFHSNSTCSLSNPEKESMASSCDRARCSITTNQATNLNDNAEAAVPSCKGISSNFEGRADRLSEIEAAYPETPPRRYRDLHGRSVNENIKVKRVRRAVEEVSNAAQDMTPQARQAQLHMALRNFETFHGLASGTAKPDQVANSSAGIVGWAVFTSRLVVENAEDVEEPNGATLTSCDGNDDKTQS